MDEVKNINDIEISIIDILQSIKTNNLKIVWIFYNDQVEFIVWNNLNNKLLRIITIGKDEGINYVKNNSGLTIEAQISIEEEILHFTKEIVQRKRELNQLVKAYNEHSQSKR